MRRAGGGGRKFSASMLDGASGWRGHFGIDVVAVTVP